MRKLTVTEYLIQANQAHTTVTAYTRLGDAINAAQEQIGGASVDLHIFGYVAMQELAANLKAQAPREGYEPYAGYGVESNAGFERVVFAWTDQGAEDVLYTVTEMPL